MPNIVKTDIGEIRFSDEYSPEQIEGILRTQLPTWRERISKGAISDLASRFPRDVATAGADTIMGAARGWQELQDYGKVNGLRQMGAFAALTSPVGEEHSAITAANEAADAKAKELEATREQRLAANPVYKFGEESKKNAQEFYQTNPTRDSSIPAMLSQGVASTIPVMAAGVAGPAAPFVAGAAYGAMSGQQGAQEAIQMGHPDKADEAYLAYAGLGVISEALLGYPIALLKKVAAARQAGVDPVAFGQSVKTSLSEIGKKIGKEILEGSGREAAQEGTEQAGQNVAAKMIGFDPDRPLTKDVVQSMLVGGAVGGLFGGVGGGALAIDEARARAAVPAMLQPDTGLVNVPGETQPGVVSAVQPTPDQQAAEEAAIVADIQRKQAIRRSPAQEVERPSLPGVPAPATVTSSEASAGLTALPVGEETGPTTRSGPPPVKTEEGARETGIQSPVRENGAQTSLILKDGTAIVGGRIHAETFAEAEKRGIKTEDLLDSTSAFTRPDGTSWNLQGTPVQVTRVLRLDDLPGPPEATTEESSAVQPEAPTKGEIPNAKEERRKEELLATPTGGQVPPKTMVQAAVLLDRLAREAVGGDESRLDEGRRFALSGEYTDEAISKAIGTTDARAADLLTETGVLRRTASGNYQLSPEVYANDIAWLTIKPAQPQEQNAIQIGSPETVSLENQPEARQGVGAQVRDAERPALPQTETPQAQGTVEPIATKKNAKSLLNKASSGISRNDLEAIVFTFGDATGQDVSLSKDGQTLRYADAERARATGNKQTGSVVGSANADFVNWLTSEASLNSDIDPLTAKAIGKMRAALLPKATPLKQTTQKEPHGDLIEYIEGNIGKIQGKQNAPAGTQGYYGEGYKEAVGHSSVRKLFSATGQTPDAIVQSLRDNRRVPDSFTVDDLWAELTKNAKGRKGNRKTKTQESVEISQQEKTRVEFERAAFGNQRDQASTKTTAIPVDDLVVGDTFDISGHKFTVKDIHFNEQTDQLESVELEDGRKFGVQQVGGQQVIHVDAGTSTQAPVEFVPPQPASPPAKAPKLRQGENQGDLISSTQSEDFALVGEKAIDFERRAREKAKAEQEAAEARAKQEREQQSLFSVSLSEPPPSSVTRADVERAFPAAQGFSVKPVAIMWTGGQPSVGYMVGLPNRQLILIDPTHDRISFDPNKAAADWGLDPALVAQYGISRGKWTPGGARVDGLTSIGVIDLLNTAGPDTLSHEKFHALFELALTPDERAAILKRYQTEEKAAEAFRRSEGFTRGFWEKMRRFLEWLENLVRGDAFKKLRQPLSTAPSQPTGRTEGQYSLQEILRSKRSLENFVNKPTISPEEATSLRQQAGAGAGLVPDAIAQEVRSLKSDDTVEGRVATLLDFVLKLHGVAPALELQRILADPNIAEDTKQAAISNVLRQIEHVRVKSGEYEDKLQEGIQKLESALKKMGKISAQQIVEARSKQVADNLITGYRAYLTAQAANLPANQNLAAARADLIRGMEASVAKEEKYPEQTRRAMEAIAQRIDELPVNEGPQAVIDAIRSKGILKGKVSDTLIDLLTSEVGGFQPLLLNPTANQMLVDLADLQKKAAHYAKQIETVEQAFRGKGEPTPVDLKKFADTYRKFRNKQAEAAKVVRELNSDIQEADTDVQVYGRATDLLTRLQQSPQFKAQLEAVLNEPGAIVFKDILESDENTHEIVYTSPLKTEGEDGKTVQHKFQISLAPDEQHDAKAISTMADLLREVDEFLAKPGIDPIEARTWRLRKEYIEQFLMVPNFAVSKSGAVVHTRYGNLNFDPFDWARYVIGLGARGPRTVLESMNIRAAREVNEQMLAGEHANNGYRLAKNNREFGDEITKLKILAAVRSHKWGNDRILYWTQQVLNPLLASNQAAGQMKLKAGDFIPGTGIKITKEDYEAALVEKKFSRAIVQTTQGTAKNLAPVLVHNPILNEQEFAGRGAKRAALSTGPLTMARQFSDWGKQFTAEWEDTKTPEGRLALIRDGLGFQNGVLGYVRTTNPEFNNQSSLLPVYEEYAANSRKDGDQVSSIDQLIDRLAPIAVSQRLFPNEQEAKAKIQERLLTEIDSHVQAFSKAVTESNLKPEFTGPKSIGQYASATNSFTRARQQMIAPDPYYNYSLSTSPERTRFVGSGMQMFQLNQITAFQRLQKALDQEQTKLDGQIAKLVATGMSEQKATQIVEDRTAKQLGQIRFRYSDLVTQKQTIEKMLKSLEELVIDARDKNDSAAIWALSRFRSTVSSTLLANIGPILNNSLGGILGAQYITAANLGRASLVLAPLRSGRDTVALLTKRLLSTYPAHTVIGAIARSNIPLMNEAAAFADTMIREHINSEVEAETWGLTSRPDIKSRIKAQGELPSSAGQIEEKAVTGVKGALNALESLPVVRQVLNQLRDKSPRAVDEVINQVTEMGQQAGVMDQLKRYAVKAFAAREEQSKRTGIPLATINDFTKRSGLLSPSELGLREANGYRNAERMRVMFQPAGIMDKLLLDYYERYKAAPADQKKDVPLFADPAAEGSVLFNMATHGNIATSGFTPPAMIGVGKRGLVKNIVFMFRNYPFRMAEQLSKIFEEDLRDPAARRKAYNFWTMLSVFIVLGLAGALGIELRKPIEKLVTGKTTAALSIENVAESPDAATLARYTGMALANNIPYYGQVISRMLGNPGYGSWWDVSELVPMFGLMKDVANTASKIGQTRDPLFPLADFASRWVPPVAPLMRLVPSIAGDIDRQNAARALRTVGPSEGMELAGGGGGQTTQTPASAEIRRLISAAYRGDAQGIQQAFDAAVAEKAAQGNPDPEKAVIASLASKEPARGVFGRAITAAEEARLIGRMSSAQRSAYQGSRDAFSLINQTLGTKLSLTTEPQARTTRGQASRRALFAGSASPIFGTRRRRLGGRRRSPLSRLQIRGASRRKRRSPSRASFAV